MTSLVARCILVGAAVVLVCAAIGLPLAGWSRAAFLGAAVWCVVLDVLLVRAERLGHDADRAPPPITAPGTVDPEPSSAPDGSTIVLGTTPDGDLIVLELDVDGDRERGVDRDRGVDGDVDGDRDGDRRDRDCGGDRHGAGGSVVVVGTGALAVAVFCAVASQVRVRARANGDLVRVASAPDLRGSVADRDEHCPALPDDHVALAVLTASPSRRSPVSTVVLVAGHATVPRRWDAVIEVSRSGCAVRFTNETRSSPVWPVLPQLPEAP